MRFAVINEGVVTNLIIANESQREEMIQITGADDIVNAAEFDLMIDDHIYEGKWRRNVAGEMVDLPTNNYEAKYYALLASLDTAINSNDIAVVSTEMDVVAAHNAVTARSKILLDMANKKLEDSSSSIKE